MKGTFISRGETVQTEGRTLLGYADRRRHCRIRIGRQIIHEKGHSMNEKGRRASANRSAGGGNAVYGLGLIGALVYYIQHADGFWSVILGILKALVWPAFVVYDLLKFMAA
jgi:hypothetical protein